MQPRTVLWRKTKRAPIINGTMWSCNCLDEVENAEDSAHTCHNCYNITSKSQQAVLPLTSCTLIFFAQRAHCELRTLLMRVTYTHGSRVPKGFFARVSHLSISPSPVSCLTHPCCSLTVTSRPVLTLTSTRSCRTYLS